MSSRAGPARRRWSRITDAVAWTPPTSTEIGTVAKSALAAGLSWALAKVVSDEPSPVLAALTALVVVQVSVRASIASALQRSAAVVLGVLLAVAIGDALTLNALTVALVVGTSLAVAQLVLRLPRQAARQVPISGLVVLSALAAGEGTSGWYRALDTVVGAVVGVVVTFVLPASRVVEVRQTLERLGHGLGDVLDSMGGGLAEPWSTDQTEAWRRSARAARDRLVDQAKEAVGNGRESARWNVRDRRHADQLGHGEDTVPRLDRTAIGVWVIARSLDDQARLADGHHRRLPVLGALLVALGDAVRATTAEALGEVTGAELEAALAEVRVRRLACRRGTTRRMQEALEHGVQPGDPLEGELLGYASVLVQVDRIVVDLSARLPAGGA